ncbi:MAG TPA: alcohol dehydrogenase, partial [Rubrivivax sp.]|nr:alcohol dehydrogenase [Rubrivivax sp.]
GIGIGRTVAALREKDIASLALAACDEADRNYPVPRQMTPADAAALLREVLPGPGRGAGARIPGAGAKRGAER